MTKDDLKAKIVPVLTKKHRKDLTWQKLVQAVQQSTVSDRTGLVDKYARGEPVAAGHILYGMVNALMRSDAEAEADAMLTDNALSFDELERIFFDGQGNGDQ